MLILITLKSFHLQSVSQSLEIISFHDLFFPASSSARFSGLVLFFHPLGVTVK